MLVVYINIDEIWKDLIYRNIKSMYEISNLGRIRNKNTGKMISECISEKGYVMVSLMTDSNKQKTFKLARIVAYNFLPLPDFNDWNIWTVNHKNGNKKENTVFNLEWVTFEDNIRHSFIEGLNKPLRGENNGMNKYSEKIIHEICALMEKGLSNREIKKITKECHPQQDINRFLFYDLRHRRNWPHITSLYKY